MGIDIKPLGDRMLARPKKADQISAGGIHLPGQAQEKTQFATVLAVGPGALDDSGRRIPMQVQVGDEVLVGQYAGQQVKHAGEELVVLRESDVLAVVG